MNVKNAVTRGDGTDIPPMCRPLVDAGTPVSAAVMPLTHCTSYTGSVDSCHCVSEI